MKMSREVSFLRRIMNSLINARERAVQVRIRQYLRGLSDRHLEEMGFSRELLEQGPKAWPWYEPGVALGERGLTAIIREDNVDSDGHPIEQGRRSMENAAQSELRGSDAKLAA